MKRIDVLFAVMLASAVGAVACDQIKAEPMAEPVVRTAYSATLGRSVVIEACDVDAECTTDSECAELCPKGTRDLPADHPDYCDGGPTPAERAGADAGLIIGVPFTGR